MKYKIDYEYGIAYFYTPIKENVLENFEEKASQCFGIRKSLGECEITSIKDEEPENKRENEYERLEHNGDLIIWNKNGEKIKSEFDY